MLGVTGDLLARLLAAADRVDRRSEDQSIGLADDLSHHPPIRVDEEGLGNPDDGVGVAVRLPGSARYNVVSEAPASAR